MPQVTNRLNVVANIVATVAIIATLITALLMGHSLADVGTLAIVLAGVLLLGNAGKKAVTPVLVVAATFLLLGCAQGMSDRGSTGDTRSQVIYQQGVFLGGAVYTPDQDIDDQTNDVAATHLDAQIAAMQEAIEAALEADDSELAADLASKLVGLKEARSSVGSITFINYGNTDINVSGTATAESPGDTTQTPTVEANPDVTVPMIP